MVKTRNPSADSGDPLRSFASRLQDLRASSGNPSVRELEKLTKDIGSPYRRSTIQDKLSGKSKPDWTFVKTFVRACHKNAGKSDEPNMEAWRKVHLAMARQLAKAQDGMRGRILCDLEEALSDLSDEELQTAMRVAGIHASVQAPASPRDLVANVTTLEQVARLIDACVHGGAEAETVAKPGQMVTPTVVFRSTGERVLVTLPLDMDVQAAAKYIVGEIFLRELPPPRRSIYLNEDVKWALVHEDEFYENGTLRDAGIGDHSQIWVKSYLGYPWSHDIGEVEQIRNYLQDWYETYPNSALIFDVRATVVERMRRHGPDLYGLGNYVPRESSTLEILGLPER